MLGDPLLEALLVAIHPMHSLHRLCVPTLEKKYWKNQKYECLGGTKLKELTTGQNCDCRLEQEDRGRNESSREDMERT